MISEALKNMRRDRALKAYQEAINKIDDYFEYRYLSDDIVTIQTVVMTIIDELNAKVISIYDQGMEAS